MSILLETSEGNVVIDLFYKTKPSLSYNFIKLCEINYYLFTPFYELKKDQIVFCGDPEYPDGDGGSAITQFADVSSFKEGINGSRFLKVPNSDEVNNVEVGTVSFLAKKTLDGDFQIGSQFSINLASNSQVCGFYIPFAKVTEGFTVLEKINNSPLDDLNSRFMRDIRIKHTHVLHDPFPAIESTSLRPSGLPSEKQLANMRIPSIQQIDHEDESIYQALTLELVGDMPNYKAKPSPSTLFVARLNPITSADSLATFFGRFGEVQDCNIIRKKQNKRLSVYAFVKFVTKETAERAFEKLHGRCFIDGYDVYVDFSQSVKSA